MKKKKIKKHNRMKYLKNKMVKALLEFVRNDKVTPGELTILVCALYRFLLENKPEIKSAQ